MLAVVCNGNSSAFSRAANVLFFLPGGTNLAELKLSSGIITATHEARGVLPVEEVNHVLEQGKDIAVRSANNRSLASENRRGGDLEEGARLF